MKTKKLLCLISLMLLFGLGLYAQTGLYGLFYDATVTEADSILTAEGFEIGTLNTENMLRYYPTKNPKVEVVTLIVNPELKTLVGWLVKYNPENTEEEDNYVFQQLTKMHFDWFKNYEETGQIVWFLSETRTAHLVYREDGSLTVLYYDSRHDKLFNPE